MGHCPKLSTTAAPGPSYSIFCLSTYLYQACWAVIWKGAESDRPPPCPQREETDTQIFAGQSDEHYGNPEGKVLEALPT